MEAHCSSATEALTTGPHPHPDFSIIGPQVSRTRAEETAEGATKDAHLPVIASLGKVHNPPGSTAQTQVLSVRSQAGEELPIESPEQNPALSKSQELWNAAYNRLEEDKDTAELVRLYVNTLMAVLGNEHDSARDVVVVAELKDPIKRQEKMKQLVEAGQVKVAKTSKITKRVGDLAQAILSVKSMVDLTIQNIPQAAPAALPWAGVYVGLQILSNPAKITKSNLAGITHVVSRMGWYCALTEYLLDKDTIETGDQSSEVVLQQLEEKVVTLYMVLLLFQMKSACSYYQHQGFVFLHDLANRCCLVADLQSLMEAENTLQVDSDQYSKLHAKRALGLLIEHARGMEEQVGDIHQDIQEWIALTKEMARVDLDAQLFRELFVVDPQDEMEKIEETKDKLLDEVYEWVLDTEDQA
ncbi:hypothetical protein DV736_g633, partial [Chaetothyriales sp. CBS 134916]